MNEVITNIKSVWAVALLLVLAPFALATDTPAQGEHLSFATPEEAVDALITALETDNKSRLASLLGPGTEDILSSGDPQQDSAERADFLERVKSKHSLAGEGNERTLLVGDNDWPFPIPVIQFEGRWYLDGDAGADEMVYRRIGRNELGAIAVCRGFVGLSTKVLNHVCSPMIAGVQANDTRTTILTHVSYAFIVAVSWCSSM